MDNVNITGVKRVRTELTMPASNKNDVILTAVILLQACNKKNPDVRNAQMKKPGLYTVDISYDSTGNDEEDRTYKYTADSIRKTL